MLLINIIQLNIPFFYNSFFIQYVSSFKSETYFYKYWILYL